MREQVPSALGWEGPYSLAMVTRESQDAGKDGEPSVESRYFISSLDLPARKILDSSIRHWTVETVHDILGMSHGEDKSKIGRCNAPALFSLVRKIGLNLIRPLARNVPRTTYASIMRLMRDCREYLYAVLTGKPKDIGPVKEMSGRDATRLRCQKWPQNMLGLMNFDAFAL
jgi:predicted transposase YbfD/YdcC